MQAECSSKINTPYVGRTVPILFEDRSKDRWRGRTPTNKIVFVESDEDLRGQIHDVTITWAGPWSMLGEITE